VIGLRENEGGVVTLREACAIAASRPQPLKIWSTSPPTCAIAAPTAFARRSGARGRFRDAGEAIGHEEGSAADRHERHRADVELLIRAARRL